MAKVTRRDEGEADTTLIEPQQAQSAEGADARGEPADDGDGGPLVETGWGAPARVAKPIPSERTNDPIRL
jgi:hypothetical protein